MSKIRAQNGWRNSWLDTFTYIPSPASISLTSHWSKDGCLELIKDYWKNESISWEELNNNLTLVTQEGEEKALTWSLIYWKPKDYSKIYTVIIPFTLRSDSRGIFRAETDFYKIKNHAVFWSQEDKSIVNEELRENILEYLYKRILSGFKWDDKRASKKNKIRRYRLVTILNDPDLILDSDLDVHHVNDVKEGDRRFYGTDDRVCNLETKHKIEHRREHYRLNDHNFKDYRNGNKERLSS